MNSGEFQVCEKMCDECLFTPARIVNEARKQELIETCKKNGSYFVCHKGSITGNHQLCCKGFYDNVQTQVTELAKTLDVVRFVPVPKIP